MIRARGDFTPGLAFLEASKTIWEILSPPKAAKVAKIIHDLMGDRPYDPPTADAAERSVSEWLKSA